MKKSQKTKKADAAAKKKKNTNAEQLSVEQIEEIKRKKVIKYSVISYAMGVAALLILVLFVAEWVGSEAWFTVFTKFFKGLFSFAAFGIPFIMVYCAYFLRKIVSEKKHKWKLVLALTILVNVSVIAGLILNHGEVRNEIAGHTSEFMKGMSIDGGGLIGAYVSWLFTKALSTVGAWILTIAIALLQVTFLIGLSLAQVGTFFWGIAKKIGRGVKKLWLMLWRKIRRKKDEDEDEEDEDEDEDFVAPPTPEEGTKYYHKPLTDNNPYASPEVQAPKKRPALTAGNEEDEDDDEESAGVLPPPVVIARPDAPSGWGNGKQMSETEGTSRIRRKENAASGSVNLDEIFNYRQDGETTAPSPVILDIDDDEEEAVPASNVKSTKMYAPTKKTTLISAVTEDDEVDEKIYTFPPVDLLTAIPVKHTDVTEELQSNGTRLVETLRSFKVRTKIVNISRGPTITRYELQPEEGVRVRQIASLVDDISLNLAASGVRIEAPIPGKSAVGVEVPNKSRETVYLRTLIDDTRFEQSQAKLTAAIGVDVAGDPIYVDLSKMPHLLIAGTTGSGKSVCMNCLILSMLYKASPDEVKMIMIDPKKVEFNVYNGLPHLIIPVVSNSKKAAGALSWAVSEMERRYELIEQVGVRDIKNYNRITANDPQKEFMPQLVIIIDELADLMLTAPGEVEESICRIAQKGRACGMHLIIGTQRPSVDVITGLIKANVPSRVAFTVSSQVDSRTIIDIAGAEKLIGKGDMLFAPIGAMKPMRLQGAFVSDEEVEEVTRFIIDHSAEAIYDDKVIRDIEKEAELCGSKGKKQVSADIDASDDGAEADPMLRSAIDLAVESGKISTSLIQRRLSLGYGRAAKLIDEMEKRGIVSPPEGQKPRNVLISAEEWHEICMRTDEI